MKFKKYLILSTAITALVYSQQSFAGGYSTGLTSTSGLGNAYAGSVTGAHDASDMFYNPSITSKFDKSQFIISVSHLDLDIDADNINGNYYGGGSVSGADVSDAGEDVQIPAFYLSLPINTELSFGLSVTTPFGLAS